MENDKMDIMQKTADRIRSLRKVKGMSQKSLARLAGLNPAFLGHIERCLKCPTVDTLNKIASALNIPLSELLRFDADNPPDSNSEAARRIAAALNGLSPEEAGRIASIVEEIVRLRNRQNDK